MFVRVRVGRRGVRKRVDCGKFVLACASRLYGITNPKGDRVCDRNQGRLTSPNRAITHPSHFPEIYPPPTSPTP